jgi:hypothetical protein
MGKCKYCDGLDHMSIVTGTCAECAPEVLKMARLKSLAKSINHAIRYAL